MADAAASCALGNGVAMEDPEKKKKKEEKAREKEAKKAKAAAKAEAAAAAQAAKKSTAGSTKQEAKPKKSQAAVSSSDTAGAASAASAAGGGGGGGDVQDPPTPHGEKKRMAATMAKAYNPRAVEAAWYPWWEASGFFTPEVNNGSKPMFSIVVPPPNITGYLHLGHALTATVQDAIVRWKRMSGYNVLWVPGTDHAGIATQTVVEKKIMREKGLTRHDLGREAFLKEVWEWRHAYGNKIGEQQRRMGASLDWTRAAFTMDEKRSEAVTEAFVRMHRQGLIYRDQRLVNWDCVLRTAISDIEVDYIQIDKRTMLRVPGYGDELVEFGAITSFAYPLADDGDGGEIVVATTRPETMLGDTAVAVHPEDERYVHLHGKFVVHPFNGRRMPIICDAELVDMAFGTGAVKITPAHDPNDFETGKRHNLEFVNILTDDGFINGNGGEFAGLKRFAARVVVVQRLQEMGLFRGVADNPMRLGLCSRSKDVIEPMIKPQWYVKCDGMAAEACAAVRDGRLTILPKQFEDVWFRWLENIRDWCISRQLWWGHRIPAWYVIRQSDKEKAVGTYNDQWVVGRTAEEAEAQARRRYPGEECLRLEQDPDVLDTWFSSGLFPFSVFEWPAQTADLDTFYPTSLLETGHDILFFWVARMVMMGMTLTGKVPFSHVFLHAMVRDAHGRKMSKSLGNVIDPLEVIEGISLEELHKKLEAGNLDPKEVAKAKAGQKADYPEGIAECGTDALRFCLLAYTTQANNINLDIQRVVGYRLWCNKLWNAIKFAMMTLGEDFTPSALSAADPASAAAAAVSTSAVPLPSSCRWILSVLSKAVRRTVTAMEAYDFSEATTAIYHWWQYQLCDVFIELSKPALNSSDESAAEEKRATRETLWTCLDTGLRLLHPFMPFVTEELWQRLPRGGCQGGNGEKEEKEEEKEEEEEEGKDLPPPPPPPPSRPPSIMVSDYPKPVAAWEDPSVEEDMLQAEDAVRAIRSLRNGYGLQKNQRPECFVQCKNEEVADRLARCRPFLLTLAALSKVEVLKEGQSPPPGCAVGIVDEGTTVHLMLRGLVDAESEISKLQKKTELLLRQQEDLRKKTNIPGYADKVPAAVQEEHAAKAAKVAAERETIDEAIRNFQKLLLST